MSDNSFGIAEHIHTREASASLQNEVKLLHIVKRMRNNASSTGENEARLKPYEAIMEIMKRCLHTMKRSLSASCFFAIKAKKIGGWFCETWYGKWMMPSQGGRHGEATL